MPPPNVLEIIKNATLKAMYIKVLKATANDENWDFYFSTADNQTLYTQYVREGAPAQVNLYEDLRGPLDKLAQVGNWGGMGTAMHAAKNNALATLNGDMMLKFQGSSDYKSYSATKTALISTRNATNLKASVNGAVLKAAFYKPLIIIGSTGSEEANHDADAIAWLKNMHGEVVKKGTLTIKKGGLTSRGSLTFGGGLSGTQPEVIALLAEFTKKKLI